MPQVKIIETSDGSQSLYLKELNETYHSTHGALTESQYVFISKGLEFWLKGSAEKQVNILEVGFGTGLNALLTKAFAQQNPNIEIDYKTLEPYPLTEDVFRQLIYAQTIDGVTDQELFEMHELAFEESLRTGNFSFIKFLTPVQSLQMTAVDLVYFDAFAPSKQADMWELPVFESLFGMMNSNGVLVTYCAQGQFKRNLSAAGFEVESLEGPPGKKEMVRAIKRS